MPACWPFPHGCCCFGPLASWPDEKNDKANLLCSFGESWSQRPGYHMGRVIPEGHTFGTRLQPSFHKRSSHQVTVRVGAEGQRRVWLSPPPIGEQIAAELPLLRVRYPKLLANNGISQAIRVPPASPSKCMFARMSTNYSADLSTRVEPCIFGGNPDCSQCGCAISSGATTPTIFCGRCFKCMATL
jgi:hypothetical protein